MQKHALLFARPPSSDTAALFEPLDRVRAIVGNVIACLKGALPANGWQHSFSTLHLQSPLGQERPGRPAAHKLMKDRWLAIFQRAQHTQPDKTFQELLSLLLVAERFAKGGMSLREAWAKASVVFPELLLARDAVTLLLGCTHSTGNVERLLKTVALQQTADRGRLLSSSLNDVFLVDAHAPLVEDICEEQVARPLVGGSIIVPKSPYLPRIRGTTLAIPLLWFPASKRVR